MFCGPRVGASDRAGRVGRGSIGRVRWGVTWWRRRATRCGGPTSFLFKSLRKTPRYFPRSPGPSLLACGLLRRLVGETSELDTTPVGAGSSAWRCVALQFGADHRARATGKPGGGANAAFKYTRGREFGRRDTCEAGWRFRSRLSDARANDRRVRFSLAHPCESALDLASRSSCRLVGECSVPGRLIEDGWHLHSNANASRVDALR